MSEATLSESSESSAEKILGTIASWSRDRLFPMTPSLDFGESRTDDPELLGFLAEASGLKARMDSGRADREVRAEALALLRGAVRTAHARASDDGANSIALARDLLRRAEDVFHRDIQAKNRGFYLLGLLLGVVVGVVAPISAVAWVAPDEPPTAEAVAPIPDESTAKPAKPVGSPSPAEARPSLPTGTARAGLTQVSLRNLAFGLAPSGGTKDESAQWKVIKEKGARTLEKLAKTLPDPDVFAPLLLFAGLGAAASVLSRLTTIDLRDHTSRFMVVISAAIRPALAVIFACVVYVILDNELVNVGGSDPELRTALILVAAFLCGYSERFGSDMLARVPFGGGAGQGGGASAAPATLQATGT